MANPASITAPAENTAINQVNDNYSGLAQSLKQQFLQTGGGTSGKYGLALASANQNRLSNISGVQNQFAQTNATLPLSVASLASNLLGMNFGSTSTGSSTGTTTNQYSTQGNSSTSGGNPFQTALASFLGSGALSSLLTPSSSSTMTAMNDLPVENQTGDSLAPYTAALGAAGVL